MSRLASCSDPSATWGTSVPPSMSCVWKSQDLLGPPVGPIGPEELITRTSAVEAEAEHKRKEPSLLDPSYQPSHVLPSSSVSPLSRPSSSPFHSTLQTRPEDYLAALQDALLAGGTLPDFSFGSRPGSTITYDPSKPILSSGRADDAPIFSLAGDLAQTSVSSTPMTNSGNLHFSTGSVAFSKGSAHRRTRSHYYETGEAPIFSTGAELEDDDESSDEESAPSTLEHPSNLTDDLKLDFDAASPRSPTIPVVVPRRAPRVVSSTTAELPESPPSRGSTSIMAHSITSTITSKTQTASSPVHICGSPRQDTPSVASAPKPLPSPEAPISFEALFSSPFSGNSQDSVDDTRELEWKVRFLNLQGRFGHYQNPQAAARFVLVETHTSHFQAQPCFLFFETSHGPSNPCHPP